MVVVPRVSDIPRLARASGRKLSGRLARARFARALDAPPRHDDRHLETLGSEYGGYAVPVGMLGPESVCYSCGVGEDASFDVELITRTGCTVYAFDPTPRAIAFADTVSNQNERFHFLPYGVWSSNTRMRFFAPEEKAHVSHSIANLSGSESYFDAECRTLRSLMHELGHDRIDLLKLDVEGAEYEILGSIVDDGVDVGIVCAEFHKVDSTRQMIASVRGFRDAGFDVVHAHGYEATFVARRLEVPR